MHSAESSSVNPPLVTVALFAYKQEAFIKEAVAAVLAQTYSPLQIILSDDASDDNTYALMQQLAAEYQGPHHVVLNRNPANLGLANHINAVIALCEGDLIVLAAGDDISAPKRTEIIVRDWLANSCPPAICSSFYSITEAGVRHGDPDTWYKSFQPFPGETRKDILERLVTQGSPALIGCTQAWSKRLITSFPPLNADVWFEDGAMSFRAWLLGGILYLPQQLVDYRQHGTNLSNRLILKPETMLALKLAEERQSTHLRRKTALLEMHKSDLRFARAAGIVERDLYERLLKHIEHQQNVNKLMAGWWSRAYPSRILAAAHLFVAEPKCQTVRWLMPRLLPFQAYLWIKLRRA